MNDFMRRIDMELMLIGLVFFAIAAGGIILLRKGIKREKDVSNHAPVH